MSNATPLLLSSPTSTVDLSVHGSPNLDDGGADLSATEASTNAPSRVNRSGFSSHSSSPSPQTKKKCKAYINVASLNIRGRGATQQQCNDKWNQIHFLLRDKKIGILALQETHMTNEARSMITSLYGRRIVLHDSACPDRQNSAGVAFILNKDLTLANEATSHVIVQGRAILLTIPWNGGETLRMLNVYAPNSPSDNAAFWKTIAEKWTTLRLPRPDIMLGDFNTTCDSLDRFPHKSPNSVSSKSLEDLLKNFELKDGWRERNPSTVEYSFPTYPTQQHKSRIDRIYITESLLQSTEGWDIMSTNVQTDHKLVIAQAAARSTSFIGKGRWTLPLTTLLDKATMKLVQARAKTMEDEMSKAVENRSAEFNPQSVYARFKDDLKKLLRSRSKILSSKLTSRTEALSKHLRDVQNAPNANSPELVLEAALLQQEINDVEEARYVSIKDNTRINVQAHNETMSRYWVRLNKEKSPRDVVYSLRKSTYTEREDPFEKRSDRMAEIARNHHDNLQSVEQECTPEERESTIRESLEAISSKLKASQRHSIEAKFSEDDVRTALSSSSAGKATGLDGLPYEFWSALDKTYQHQKKVSPACSPFNPMKALATVFNDIADFGILEGSSFAEGWMCPIYKNKGDRRDIVNYRPITLLNTDYKLMTKILALRIAATSHSLVHKDQAGFIPGRSIADQVRLVQSMLDLAEATEENGAIIALDQEKAYDKISHDYLWRVLRKFNLPLKTIRTIQALYANAFTQVAVNGELSSPFRVIRGVRQGDPLSCILFDLAIEPLASMIRKSNLIGFTVPGADRRIITALFADDTTVFLSEHDSYHGLLNILQTWCMASKAKFNTDKTVIIPIGSAEYRASVVQQRSLGQDQSPFPDGGNAPKILRDGQYTRILGAFVGNKITPPDPWKPVVEKVRKALERWKSAHPTFHGKKLIVQMVVGGFTQYLTKVQGMPSSVEKSLTAMIRSFMWDDNQPRLSLPTLCLPISEGGLGLLDLAARNKAIELTWVKTFLDLSENRPLWAFVVDTILTTPLTRTNIPKSARMNPFLQQWNIPTSSRSKLPERVRALFKAAKLAQVHVATVKISKTLRRHLPIWYHIGASATLAKLNNIPSAKCLRDAHGVRTVADTIRVSIRHRKPRRAPLHQQHQQCNCPDCAADRTNGCKNPALCSKTAARLLDSLHPIWQPICNPKDDGLSLKKKEMRQAEEAYPESGVVQFNPSVTTRGQLASLFRAFAPMSANPHIPAHRPPAFLPQNRPVSVSISSHACTISTPHKQAGGFCLDYAPNEPGSVLIPTHMNGRLAGLLAAITEACHLIPPDSPLYIRTSSGSLIRSLTFNLPDAEDAGWYGADSSCLLQHAVNALRARPAVTYLIRASGERDDPQIARARDAAKRCLDHAPLSAINLSSPLRYVKQGILLSTISQSLAYRTYCRLAPPKPRARTRNMIERVQDMLVDYLGSQPTQDKIWMATRLPDFTQKVRVFLWKALHDIHSTGSYWSKIPDRSHFEFCPHCNVTESLEHILLECDLPPRKTLWALASNLLTRKNVLLPRLNLGYILGCGLISLSTKECKRPGATRLLHIVVSETAYLLWKLRCERRIPLQDKSEDYPSKAEITHRWYAAIDSRLNIDKSLVLRGLNKNELNRILVERTWGGVLHDEDLLPPDWISSTARVLVGRGQSGTRRPRRRPDR